MNLKRCNAGHFYDASKHETCPHCKTEEVNESNNTMNVIQEQKTMPLDNGNEPMANAVESMKTQPLNYDNGAVKTVGVWDWGNNSEIEPVVGWLICTKGENFGEDYRITAELNYIGREADNDICISKDEAISRKKHAIIVYEPKSKMYLVQPGDSKKMFYLNGTVVLTPTEIKKNDVLSLGNTELLFMPLCDNNFSWDKYKSESEE